MGDFYRCIDFIIAEEGGYANHPADPGGETKYGISQRSYPTLDIAALTLDEAITLYQRDYWLPIHGDVFPDGLALLLLDSAVNQGPVTAITLLQQEGKTQNGNLRTPRCQRAAPGAKRLLGQRSGSGAPRRRNAPGFSMD